MFKLALWLKELGHSSGRNVITVEEMRSVKVAGSGPSAESFLASFRATVESPSRPSLSSVFFACPLPSLAPHHLEAGCLAPRLDAPYCGLDSASLSLPLCSQNTSM